MRDAPEAVARAVSMGARELGQRHLSETGDGYVVMASLAEVQTGDGYVVMADPEGNEFCFVVDDDGSWETAARTALAAAPRR